MSIPPLCAFPHLHTQLVTGKDAQEPLSVSRRVVFNIKSTSEEMKENQGHHKQNMSCYVKLIRELKNKCSMPGNGFAELFYR